MRTWEVDAGAPIVGRHYPRDPRLATLAVALDQFVDPRFGHAVSLRGLSDASTVQHHRTNQPKFEPAPCDHPQQMLSGMSRDMLSGFYRTLTPLGVLGESGLSPHFLGI